MRYDNAKYRAWVRQFPCVVCGDNTTTETCHIRYADATIGKASGIGAKPSDYFCTPMCGAHHRMQHRGNERVFWQGHGIDPIKVSLKLFAIYITGYDTYQRGLAVLNAARQNGEK